MAKTKIINPQSANNKPKRQVKLHKLTPQIVAQALVVLAVFGVIIFCLPNLPQMPSTDTSVGYKGVINLWLVDSFEGGSGSRQSWFTKCSAKFEAQNKGLFVCVTALTESQLADKLESGQNFDMICFSRGVGASLLDKLAPLDVDFGGVMDNFIESCKVSGRPYAVPVYTGVYCLFARQSQQSGDLLANCLSTTFTRKIGKNKVQLAPLVCGFTPYNSPLTALAMSGVKGTFSPNYNRSQYTAYEQFVGNKTAVTLLGTQRDMYRLDKRLQMGRMENLLFAPLTSYTDLVAYVGIGRTTQNANICAKFVQYLLGDTVQQSVTDMSMFSVTKQDLYTKDWYDLCEKGLSSAYVPNVFANLDTIENSRQTALDTLNDSMEKGTMSKPNNNGGLFQPSYATD